MFRSVLEEHKNSISSNGLRERRGAERGGERGEERGAERGEERGHPLQIHESESRPPPVLCVLLRSLRAGIDRCILT